MTTRPTLLALGLCLVLCDSHVLAQKSKTPPTDRFTQMLQRLGAPPLRVEAVADSGQVKAKPQVKTGEKFHLRVHAQTRGAVYVLGLDSKGRPVVIAQAAKPFSVAMGRPLELPDFSVKAPGAQEYLILQRRDAFLGAVGTSTDVPDTPTTSGTETNVPGTETDVAEAFTVSSLLDLFERDPKGTWVSTRIKVNVTR